MNWVEWIGYAASLGIMVSMLMTSVLKLRMINLAGCVLFLIYGYIIGAWPVAIVNFFIALINIFYLRKMLSARKPFFSVMAISPKNIYVKRFIDFYKNDIRKFIPGFYKKDVSHDHCWLLMKDMKVAGIFMGANKGYQTLEIHLDYILPEYRDFKVGRFLYEQNKALFLEHNYERLMATPGHKKHNKYLEKMGFKLQDGIYQRTLV
ncbi:MAG: GNAT family N-acetyltransferase [Bacteroidota bacterium]